MDAGHPLCWLENKPTCICPKETKDTKGKTDTKATMPGRMPEGAQGSQGNEYRVYVLNRLMIC